MILKRINGKDRIVTDNKDENANYPQKLLNSRIPSAQHKFTLKKDAIVMLMRKIKKKYF